MARLLEGKVALITGASRGIGRNIAIEMAKEGADIVVAARTEQPIERLPGTIYSVAEQIEALGRRALSVRCDIVKDDEVEALARRAIEEFGRVDILVNNAGITAPGATMSLPAKRWDIVMNVNVRGTFIVTKAFLPHMVERKGGSIINISSAAAGSIARGAASNVYGTSKAAIDRFSQGLANEMKSNNIAVNSLSPSKLVMTEGWLYWNQGITPAETEGPEVMGRAAVFLAIQDAAGVTGRILFSQEVLKEFGFA